MQIQRNAPRLPKPRLKMLRNASGIKRESFAEMTDVDCATVDSWERGSSPIPDELIASVAEYFGVSVAYLMCWEHVAPSRIPEQYRAPVAADDDVRTEASMRRHMRALLDVLERRLFLVDAGSSEHDRMQELRTTLLPWIAEQGEEAVQ